MEPPTPELRAQQAYLMSILDAYKSDLSQLVSDKKMNPTYMKDLAEQSDVLLEGSNEVVKMYIGL
ncbi:MAG: hypothetical protein AAF754_20295, partial [Pseudomonadota bacterium]